MGFVALAVAYFALAQWSLAYPVPPENYARFWFASGLSLGVLLLTSRRTWPLVLVIVYLINLLCDLPRYTTLESIGFSLAHTVEPLIAALLVGVFIREPVRLDRLRHVLLIAAMALPACAVAAVIGAVSIDGAGVSYLVWRVWLMDDFVGILLVAPLVIGARVWWPARGRAPLGRVLEYAALLGGMAVISVVCLSKGGPNSLTLQYPFWAFVFLPWAALRFGPAGSAPATFILAAIAVTGTVLGRGPFAAEGIELSERAISLQFFICVASLTTMTLAAAFAERRSTESELKRRQAILRRQNAALAELTGPDAIGASNMQAAFRRISRTAADALDVERVAVWLAHDDFETLTCVCLYERTPDTYSSGERLAAADYPAYIESLKSARTIAADDAPTDPRTECLGENYLKPLGITSMLDAPVRIAGRTVGVVCHEHVGPARTWAEEDISFSGAAADCVALVVGSHERQEAEAALQASEERYGLLVESMNEGLTVVDADWIITYANQRFCEMLGYTREEIEGTHAPDLIDEQQRNAFSHQTERRREGDEAPYELTWRHKNGQAIELLVSPRILTGPDGEYEGSFAILTDITERKSAEQQLRRSEGQLRAFFDNTAIGIAVATPDGRYVQVNDHYLDMFGYESRDALFEQTVGDVTHEDDRAETREAQQALAAGDVDVVRLQKRYVRRDASVFWGDTSVAPIREPGGRIEAFVATISDITDQKQVEETLRVSEERYRSIIALSRSVAYQYDMENQLYTFMDEGIEELTGYAADEITPPLFRDLIRGGKVLPPASRDEELTPEQPFYRAELRLETLDGREVWVEDIAVRIHDEAGKVLYALGMFRDVTEQKQAEKSLRDSEATARALLNSLPDVSMLLDADGTIITINENASAELGRPAEDVVGRSVWEMVTPDAVAKYPETIELRENAIRTALSTGEPAAWDDELGGKFWTHRIHPVLDADGKVFRLSLFSRDITDRKRLEEHTLQSSKLESIGTLAGGVAHDFNNILTGILGYADILLYEGTLGSEGVDELRTIRSLAERAAGLTRQLLAFSRRHSLEPVALNVNQLIENLAKMLQRIIGEDVEAALDLSPDPCVIEADPGQIEQILMNLAVNARDAMPGGGVLSIKTGRVVLDEEYTNIHTGVEPGPYVEIAVTDAGHGMDEATQARMFEPFFTTKQVGEGTGLGLATVYGIVGQHHGGLAVESEPGKGTTVTVYLPQIDTEAGAADQTPEDTPRGAGMERILLVEDEESVLKLVTRILTQRGYDVYAASTPEQAQELFAEHGAEIDLVLTDIVMPGMAGPELCDRLAEIRPGFKVLYMSGYSHHPALDSRVRDSDEPFIQKPFTPNALAQRVRDVLES